MPITLATPTVADLGEATAALASWQEPGTPLQLHPGDLGWFWRFGAERTAAATRTWRRDGEVVAIGMLDEPDLLRVAISPAAQQDPALADQLVADLVDPERGVLPAGEACVETPPGALVHDQLGAAGWGEDEPWSLLSHDLSAPVDDPGVAVEIVGADEAADWAAVLGSAFGSRSLLEERVAQWHSLRSGTPGRPTPIDGGGEPGPVGHGSLPGATTTSQSLLARDADGIPVAAVTVWTAGPGRYGLLEPMGVHADHRGHGYGQAISRAAAAALRDLGACAALVATTSANVGAVATYRAAGFALLGERRDRRRAG